MTSKYNHESIVRHAASMQADIERLAAEVATLKKSFGTLQEYIVPPLANLRSDDAERYWHKAEDAYRGSVDICAQNDAAAEANRELLTKLVAIIDGAGLKTHTRRLKSRSSWKTEEVTADWLANLRSAVPAPKYTTEWLNRYWKELSERHEKMEAERMAEKERREREWQEAERRRLQVITLALAGRDLGIDTSTMNADGLIQAIRRKDKYLDLAVAMQETRGDWSEGFYRVKDALGRFEIESPRDKELYEAVSGACYGEETDGRIFRDLGEYGYDAVFGLADQSLVEIYGKITENE